jgi:hypothetical protein
MVGGLSEADYGFHWIAESASETPPNMTSEKNDTYVHS